MEEKKEPANSQPEEKGRENRLLIIVIFILAILLLLLCWQYWSQKQSNGRQIDAVTAKADSVRTSLLNLQKDFVDLKTTDKNIQDQLNRKKDTITMLMQQAEKYKDDPYIIAKLKKETETLRNIMKGFVITIDSLNTLNKKLTQERNDAVDSLASEKNTSTQLKKEKNKLQSAVNTGSLLEATNVTAEGVHFRFGKKEVVTDKAKKAEKLKVQFTITANRIAKSGNRNIYVRVITPDGKELSQSADGTSIFSFEGTKGYYDAVQSIDYVNQELSLVVYCENSNGFVPGNYIIKLYSDGAEIGTTTLNLN